MRVCEINQFNTFQSLNSPREWSGAVAMVSNDLLGIQDELVWNRDGLEVTSLRAFSPESRETCPPQR